MMATIWHNPRCSKSRAALERLERAGYDVTVIEYLQHPPSRDTLARLYRSAGITPAQGLRLTGTDAAARGLAQAGDDAVLAAMVADPALIERPLVETARGVRLCRPADLIEQII